MSSLKSKTAAKLVVTRSQGLDSIVSNTLSLISEIVGGTLGPGGHPVLIERQEHGMPPLITKDGVTVFRALGFQNAVAHAVMESARDASVRTASEAGDGTTTATILAEGFNRYLRDYQKSHPGVSPHWILTQIQKTFENEICPLLAQDAIRADLESDDGKVILEAVAALSGNGDIPLARAVMKCFDITGDDGNVTITEGSGPSKYDVERIEGFPVGVGLEQCCQRYSSVFINDAGSQRCVMDSPLFILNYGQIVDFNSVQTLLAKINDAWQARYLRGFNVVLVSTGFSETVLANLASIWSTEGSINVFPLVVPPSPIPNSQREFLDDLAAVVNAKVLDPLTAPMEGASLLDLGNILETDDGSGQPVYETTGVTMFESSRFRSSLVGYVNEDQILLRADEVRVQAESAGSEMDRSYLQERLAKLTGGIAKLKVIGSSNGEIKERKDRAEDAVCAVRGALKSGCLVGGGWTLLKIIDSLPDTEVNREIIGKALLTPVTRLCENSGVHATEIDKVLATMRAGGLKGVPQSEALVRNAATGEFVNGLKAGLLDSYPAVYEAIKNSISIAGVLGTTGGVVVYPRDHAVDLADARDSAEWNRLLRDFDPNEKA